MTTPLTYDVELLHKAIKVGATVAWSEADLNEVFVHRDIWAVGSAGSWNVLWPLGGRNNWEGAGGDPCLQNTTAGEGHRRCLQTG